MTRSKKVSFLRGRRMRATRLDGAGRPVYGDGNVATTKGFITVGYTSNTEEGEAISVTNASGDICVNEPGTPSWTGVSVEAEFCDVDFALFEMLTGQALVLDPVTGTAIGLTESTSVDMSNVRFALELWLGAATDETPHENSEGFFGYVLTPYLTGGTLGDISIENGAITFTITGMSTRNGTGWGAGPYNVELGADGTPGPLSTPMGTTDHRRIQIVEVAPPEPISGAGPLLDPDAAPITALTPEVVGNAVTFTPEPAGTDPIWYDFGDGTWDYAETGTYEHTYAGPGTYRVIARRGSSEVTETVTVS